MRKILVVDDDQDFRRAMDNVLKAAGYRVLQAQDGKQALDLVENEIPDIVLLDYRIPGRDGLRVAEDTMQKIPGVPIVMITGYGEVKLAVEAMRMGVYDYITKPVDNNDLLFTIKRALEKQELVQEVEQLKNALSERASLFKLMGKSKQIVRLVHLVEKVAPTSFTTLIDGESGSGKEIVARAIHNMSEVKDGPFVAVDCGAIPETLIESELFGYTKGSFTGAHKDKPGQFELADGGSLFLDEVGNLPYSAQQKLLRAMQQRVIQRLGASRAQPVRVRIIAATNQPLEEDIKSGNFRDDLYFRLQEFVIRIPPLRERKEDISYLTKKFMEEVQGELGKKCSGISKDAFEALVKYHWPGNVRELRNVVRQAVLLCEKNGWIEPEQLMLNHHSISPGPGDDLPASSYFLKGDKSLSEVIKAHTKGLEKRLIAEMLAETKGNKSEAARRLGIDYKTLFRKIKIHHLEPSQ